MNFPRITVEQGKMGGKACIRGMRITVTTVLRMLAGGMTTDEILADFPYLEREDVAECLRYAAFLAEEQFMPLGRTA